MWYGPAHKPSIDTFRMLVKFYTSNLIKGLWSKGRCISIKVPQFNLAAHAYLQLMVTSLSENLSHISCSALQA